MYFDGPECLPLPGRQSSFLTDFMESGIGQTLDWRRVLKAAALNIQQILEVHDSNSIALMLKKGGVVNIFDRDTGRDLNLRFHKLGRQTALYLAVNKALRSELADHLDVPFVVDSCLGYLDLRWMARVWEFIRSMAAQVILLENRLVGSELGLMANYEIHGEIGSPRSKVIAHHLD